MFLKRGMVKRGKAKNLVIACSGAKHIAEKIAKKSKSAYVETVLERFPDTELKVRLGKKSLKGKNVYLIQSFYKSDEDEMDINDRLMEVLFSAYTAKELKAKKIFLIAPYLAYLREDKRFEKNESINARILAELFKIFNKVYVLEPHLHRFKSFTEFFPNAKKISLSNEVATYIQKNVKNSKREVILVGPDMESEQWVKPVAKKLNAEHVILKKTRFSSRKVKVHGKKVSKNKVIVIDDIISTGGTMIEAGRLLRAKKIYFIGMHGLFAEGALKKLKKKGRVVVSNSIPSKASKLDCTGVLAEIIK
ncbi:ribose-phosphate diphosphokinase [Candidatus Pacearchaeota archaeon]|nr:ribose-phosphate diphosphokinase [Candidatus Pacearchaeota archaeon]